MKHARTATAFVWWLIFVLKFVLNTSRETSFGRKRTEKTVLVTWFFFFTQLLFIPRNTTVIIPRRDQENVLHEHVYSGRSSEGG